MYVRRNFLRVRGIHVDVQEIACDRNTRYENQDFGFDEWNSRNPLLLISSTDSGSDSVNSGAKSAQFLSFIRRMPTAWKLALPRPFGTARELACGRAPEVARGSQPDGGDGCHTCWRRPAAGGPQAQLAVDGAGGCLYGR